MRVRVVTPPDPIIDWQDAAEHLRMDPEDPEDIKQQNYVQTLIAAATAHIDGPGGWLGRAIGVQTLEATFDSFHDLMSDLPFPPQIDVVSLIYLDATGIAQTLATSGYEMLGGRLVPALNSYWPSAYWMPGSGRPAVTVRYRAGYVADPGASTLEAAVPPSIIAAVLLMVGDLFNNRETTADGRLSGVAAVPMSTTVEALLGPFRVWR